VVTGRRELALAPAIVAVKTAARRDNPSLPRHGDEEMWDPNLGWTIGKLIPRRQW